MDILNYITENSLLLVPVLVIVGMILKNVELIPDKYIPVILLPLGVLGAMAMNGWNVEQAIQGILVTGCAVYGHQLYKQLKKNGE